jgi:hypothetical protein
MRPSVPPPTRRRGAPLRARARPARAAGSPELPTRRCPGRTAPCRTGRAPPRRHPAAHRGSSPGSGRLPGSAVCSNRPPARARRAPGPISGPSCDPARAPQRRIEQAGQLHRDGRGAAQARLSPSLGPEQVVPGRLADRPEVDAAVLHEALVLGLQHRRAQAGEMSASAIQSWRRAVMSMRRLSSGTPWRSSSWASEGGTPPSPGPASAQVKAPQPLPQRKRQPETWRAQASRPHRHRRIRQLAEHLRAVHRLDAGGGRLKRALVIQAHRVLDAPLAFRDELVIGAEGAAGALLEGRLNTQPRARSPRGGDLRCRDPGRCRGCWRWPESDRPPRPSSCRPAPPGPGVRGRRRRATTAPWSSARPA